MRPVSQYRVSNEIIEKKDTALGRSVPVEIKKSVSHHHAPYGKETVTLVVVGYASHPSGHDMAVWSNQLGWD